MAKLFPELVFVRGPQKGQRFELSKTMSVLGREPGCEVLVQDEYASRQHARVVVEGNRVRIVNVSPNGTRVNGRAAEQVTLSHGDVISIGLECEIRFEAPDAPAATRGVPSGPVDTTRVLPSVPSVGAGRKPADEPDKKAPPKKPRMMMYLGGYLVGVVVLFIVLSLLRSDAPGMPPAARGLSDTELARMIDAPIKGLAASDNGARETTLDACRKYEQWKTGTTSVSHLYGTLTDFKTALAYRGNEPDFGVELYTLTGVDGGKVKVDDLYREVRDAFYDQVRCAYKNAYVLQRSGQYRRAQEQYQAMLKLVPDQQNEIHRHVLKQLNYVVAAMREQRERSSYRGS